MKISVIVLAAGSGTRAGLGVNKVLAPIYGAPVLYHVLNTVNGLKNHLEDGDELTQIIVTS